MLRKLKHVAEAVLVITAFTVFRMLPLDKASALGGWIGRKAGPHLARPTRVALCNIERAFPDMLPGQRVQLMQKMWENIGRCAAEMAFLRSDALPKRMTFRGLENFRTPAEPMFFVSAHLGNWELVMPMLHACGIPITGIYRHANNPWMERWILHQRALHTRHMIRKGPKGAPALVRALKERLSVALLVDQKMNDGIAVPFFGHPAMTAPAVAKLALKYNYPIIPVRIKRTKGAHFEAIAYPALKLPEQGTEEEKCLRILTDIHALLENWIRETPEQWFWIHRRWEKEFYIGAASTSPS